MKQSSMKLDCQQNKKLTRPKFHHFVDETGCNTNQLNNGKVGGECLLYQKYAGDTEVPAGAATNLQFMVLPFISGTGEPVVCAIIFRSDQHISEIPLSWKTGLI
jgi:hypothetical protein